MNKKTSTRPPRYITRYGDNDSRNLSQPKGERPPPPPAPPPPPSRTREDSGQGPPPLLPKEK